MPTTTRSKKSSNADDNAAATIGIDKLQREEVASSISDLNKELVATKSDMNTKLNTVNQTLQGIETMMGSLLTATKEEEKKTHTTTLDPEESCPKESMDVDDNTKLKIQTTMGSLVTAMTTLDSTVKEEVKKTASLLTSITTLDSLMKDLGKKTRTAMKEERKKDRLLNAIQRANDIMKGPIFGKDGVEMSSFVIIIILEQFLKGEGTVLRSYFSKDPRTLHSAEEKSKSEMEFRNELKRVITLLTGTVPSMKQLVGGSWEIHYE